MFILEEKNIQESIQFIYFHLFVAIRELNIDNNSKKMESIKTLIMCHL